MRPWLRQECPSGPIMPPEILLVDYGMGNLKSVARALQACGYPWKLVSEPTPAGEGSILVLPGVGAFPAAMKKLRSSGMAEWTRASVAQGAWMLGICLGMQLLMELGEEFEPTQGLSLIPGKVKRIPEKTRARHLLKLPHIGWSGLFPRSQEISKNPLWKGIPAGTHFYFVHSYVVEPADPSVVLANCLYGGHALPAVVRAGRVMGCQFHPEKSGPLGLSLLANFLEFAASGRATP